MAARDFEFGSGVRVSAWARQRKVCALCGHNLKDLIHSDNCHHVIPDQAGDPRRLSQADQEFLRSVDNAVVLCHGCHRVWAHEDGRTKHGAVPPFGEFRFSHGKSVPAAHDLWLAKLRTHAQRIWPKYKPHARDSRLSPSQASEVRKTILEWRSIKRELQGDA